MPSRKDYRAIAEAIQWTRETDWGEPNDQAVQEALDKVAEYVADYFKGENGRFDRHLFYTAAGVQQKRRGP